jgi:hypothetical protein
MRDRTSITALVNHHVANDPVDTVVLGNGSRQSFEHKKDTSFSPTISIGVGVKGFASPRGAEKVAFS